MLSVVAVTREFGQVLQGIPWSVRRKWTGDSPAMRESPEQSGAGLNLGDGNCAFRADLNTGFTAQAFVHFNRFGFFINELKH